MRTDDNDRWTRNASANNDADAWPDVIIVDTISEAFLNVGFRVVTFASKHDR